MLASEARLTRVYLVAFTAYSMALLFGWETGVAGGVIAQPVFTKAFGITSANKTSVSSNIVSVLQAGAFFGSLAAPWLNDWLGRRKSLAVFNALLLIGSLLQTLLGVRPGLALFYAGRVIAGLGLGGGSSISPAYVAECAPANVRGRVVGLFQIILALGVTVSYFVNYAMGKGYAGTEVWRVPLGLQLLPSASMFVGLLLVRESPRWLMRKGRTDEALRNLAWYRRTTEGDEAVRGEAAEIEAAVEEERRSQLGIAAAWRTPGTPKRFFIAFWIFTLQQWSAQNSVGYFAPQIFQSIGYSSSRAALLATGVYGVVKLVATALAVLLGVERLGRRPMLLASALGMGVFFIIIGAVLKTHPPDTKATSPSAASQAMAGMLYIYVVFYSFGLGPLPWIVVSEIFNNRTRHLGVAFSSAVQWLMNFAVSQATPRMVDRLGWGLFLLFGVVNAVLITGFVAIFLPETRGRTLEEMDVVFGAVGSEERRAHIDEKRVGHDGSADEAAPAVAEVKSQSGSSDDRKAAADDVEGRGGEEPGGAVGPGLSGVGIGALAKDEDSTARRA